jgi:site-specific DNA recombinase
MLLNQRYIGSWTWNQRKWVHVPGKKSRRVIERPEIDHVTKEMSHLRIIAPDLWEKAQARFRRTASKRGPGRPSGSGGEATLLSGLLKCGVCGGSMAVVGRAKKNGVLYRNIGCNVYRKVRDSVLGFLKTSLTAPGLVERFVKQFQERYLQLEKSAPMTDLTQQIHQAEQRVRNLLDVLAKMGWSESLTTRLKEEEERLVALRTKAAALSQARPKTVPHPRIIEGYLRNLLAILDGDRTRAHEALAKHLGRLVLTPGENGGYQITGAFGLSLGAGDEVTGLVCDNSSSGGVI